MNVDLTPEVEALLAANAPVAVGVSGGKDSCAVAIAVGEYLHSIKHVDPKILVHADLGLVEWMDSGPTCERLQYFMKQRYDPLMWDLVVTRRAAGGMMERWEGRWASSKRRYINLECVKVILPWSTPSMRFCTAELKRDPITSALKKRFGKQPIVSVTGIRAEESPNRAKMPIAKEGVKLPPGSFDWNAILTWKLGQVWEATKGFQMHEAYALGSTRVSCVWCIMGSENDFRVALKDMRYDPLYKRMTALELTSGFAFQGGKWLSDLAPERAAGDVHKAKVLMREREEIEACVPKHLLYVKGWPVAVPTQAEAELLSRVRVTIGRLYGWEMKYTTVDEIQNRYAELMALHDS